MTSIIRVLDDKTINQIAAGEVVENPSSVIKELVENALDAKAHFISIEIKGGGFYLIKVIDDGVGMSGDDALLALERHATSKIKHIQDLMSISSMGFRGEALASIAAISKMHMMTALENDKHLGTEILCEGSYIKNVAPCSRQKGTTIEIKSLFYNVPARKKFQKSAAMSLAEISKVVTMLALSRPDVGFRFFADGKKLIETETFQKASQQEIIKQRASDVLGQEMLKEAKYVFAKQGRWTLEGFLGSPQQSRSNRLKQFLYVNQRSVTSLDISYAVSDGYASMLAERKFPFFLLYLKVPEEEIDINIHPQKKEVKFRETMAIKAFIRKAVGEALDSSQGVTLEKGASFFHKRPEKDSLETYHQNFKEFKHSFQQDLLPERPPQPTVFSHQLDLLLQKAYIGLYQGYALFSSEPLKEFLDDEGLVFVHLKAMQQKLHFDSVMQSFEKEDIFIERQALLFPEKITLSSSEAENILRQKTYLMKLGIEVRPFGTNTFVIESAAPIYEPHKVKEFLLECAQGGMIKEEATFDLKKKLAQKSAKLASCRFYNRENSLALVKEFLTKKPMKSSFQGLCVIGVLKEVGLAKLFHE